MIATASRAIRKIILAVKHFSRRVFENAKGSSYIESIGAEFPTKAEEKVQRPAMYSPDSERSETRLKPADPGDPAAKQLLARIAQLEAGKREQR